MLTNKILELIENLAALVRNWAHDKARGIRWDSDEEVVWWTDKRR